MLSHEDVSELLVGYSDGMLSAAQRAAVDRHLQACRECAAEVTALRRLNAALTEFPPAPAVAFHPFWARLQSQLPAPAVRTTRLFTPGRRLALAFALAALVATMVGVSAFASESALPDSPLFVVKRLREQVQLTLTLDSQTRVQLELQLATERLREAQVMAGSNKPGLAVSSLRDFDRLLDAIEPALKHPASEPDREAVLQILRSLRLQLAGVQEVNETKGGDDAEVKGSVQTARQALSRDDPEDVQRDDKKAEDSTTTKQSAPSSTPTAKPSQSPEPTESESPKPSESPNH